MPKKKKGAANPAPKISESVEIKTEKPVKKQEIKQALKPKKINSGYYYEYGDDYIIDNTQWSTSLVKMGRLMRLEKGRYRVIKSFIFDKIIGEHV